MEMKLIVLAVVAVGLCMTAQADLIAEWDFAGNVGDEVSDNADTLGSGISSAVIMRGAGITASANAGRFNANNWTQPDFAGAFANGDYFSMTITADASSTFDVSDWAFKFERSSTGPTEWALYSSADAYNTAIDSYTALGNSSQADTLSGQTGLSSVTFRFYGWGNTATAGSAGFEGSGFDLQFNGTVTTIPEPTTIALIGLGLGGMLAIRRRARK